MHPNKDGYWQFWNFCMYPCTNTVFSTWTADGLYGRRYCLLSSKSFALSLTHVLLKGITLDSIQTTIRVRAVRFCEHLNNETPPQPLWIDLVLLDEEGKAMAGQVSQRWIALFKEQVKQDSVYYISYFQVCNAQPTDRPVDHPYMMRFTAHTKVHELGLMCLTPGLIKLNIHQILLEF